MNGMRILGAVCASILASSLGTLAACGGTPDAKEATTAQAVSAASVSIALFDENGTRVGEGSGVMIAPRLVLTSGHLISGKHKWVVTSADGKQKVNGSRGMTYDWMKYDSLKAHPRKHDVGVIHLDESIKLSSYPKLVGEKSPDGAKATRIRGTGAGFQGLDATLAKFRESPNAFLSDSVAGETLDTGGAVYDTRGILGIVSGRGQTTGKLYIARVDGVMKWLAPKIACAGGATGVRTYAGPATDKSKEICEDAGTGTGTGTGSDSTSGGPGGPGSTGPGGDTGGSCDGNNDGVCSGDCSGGAGNTGTNKANDGTPGSSGSDGSNAGSSGTTTNAGNDGTPGSSGSGSNTGTGSSGTNTGSATPGSSSGDTNTAGSAPGSSGSGSNSGTDTTKANDGTPGSSGSGGTNTAPGGDSGEACQGASDNPDVCPPEPDGCTGPSCGGGKPDDTIDYGNCACGGSSSSSDGIYLR